MQDGKIKQYKIINADGKFSTGGQHPHFDKTGYIWPDYNTLRNHLSLFKYGQWSIYEGCKIVTYVVEAMPEEDVNLVDIFDKQKEEATFQKLKGNAWY